MESSPQGKRLLHQSAQGPLWHDLCLGIGSASILELAGTISGLDYHINWLTTPESPFKGQQTSTGPSAPPPTDAPLLHI